MSQEEEIANLAAHFRALGADDPEGWAGSQIREGIPQYAKFVFLKQAWEHVITDGDTQWIQRAIANRNAPGPGEGLAPALERLLASGANPEDIAEVVRIMQWWTLAGIISQLDDSEIGTDPHLDVPEVHWALVETDEDGKVLHRLDALHESMLELDPSGRQMGPKEKI